MTGATDPGNFAQIKAMAQQAAEIALQDQIGRFQSIERAIQEISAKLIAPIPVAAPAPVPQVEMPAPMKWAAGIISALLTAGVAALFFWLISTVNDMQLTLAGMDARQKGQVENLDSRFNDQDRRITKLERFHNKEGGI